MNTSNNLSLKKVIWNQLVPARMQGELLSWADFTCPEAIGRNLKAGQFHTLHLRETDSKMFIICLLLSYTNQTHQKYQKATGFVLLYFPCTSPPRLGVKWS